MPDDDDEEDTAQLESDVEDNEMNEAIDTAVNTSLLQSEGGEEDDLERQALVVVARERLRREEDGYEKQPTTLEPLPQENDSNYPQDNKAYFSQKRYVRLDKYELNDFIFDDAPMPTIRDLFK